MATAVIYAEESDDTISFVKNGGATPWGDAREGIGQGGPIGVIEPYVRVGQGINGSIARVYQAFLAFDTSALGPGALVRSVTLSLFENGIADDDAQTIEARLYDWGGEVDADDFRPASDAGDDLLLGTLDGTTVSPSDYFDFASEAEFVGAIDTNGITRLYLISDVTRTGTPTPTTQFAFFSWASANAYDDDQDPKLTIDYLPPFVSCGGSESGGTLTFGIPERLAGFSGSSQSGGSLVWGCQAPLELSGGSESGGTLTFKQTHQFISVGGSG